MTSEYTARIDGFCRRMHAQHGCTTLCPPDCKYKDIPVKTEIPDPTELEEVAALLAEHTPASTEEMAEICAELHKAMDAQDAIKAAEDKATAELRQKLEAARAPFEKPRAAAAALIVAAKAALVRRVEADEAATLAAVRAGKDAPEPTKLPKGLRSTTKAVLASVDLEKLPDEYLTAVADADKILQHAEAGMDVPGAVVEITTGVVYTRPRSK